MDLSTVKAEQPEVLSLEAEQEQVEDDLESKSDLHDALLLDDRAYSDNIEEEGHYTEVRVWFLKIDDSDCVSMVLFLFTIFVFACLYFITYIHIYVCVFVCAGVWGFIHNVYIYYAYIVKFMKLLLIHLITKNLGIRDT